MKIIKNMNNKINKIYQFDTITKKFDNFCKTKRAKSLVKDIDKLSINTLYAKYFLSYLSKLGSESTIRSFIRHKLRKHNIVNYTHIVRNKFIPYVDRVRHFPWGLSKEERKKIEASKTKTTLTFTERLDRLCKYKLEKWENKHKPTFKQLKNDLFPRMMIQGFLDLKDRKEEMIREKIASMYSIGKNKSIVWLQFMNGTRQFVTVLKNRINVKRNPNIDIWQTDFNDNKFAKIEAQVVFNDICLRKENTMSHIDCTVYDRKFNINRSWHKIFF